MQVKVCKNCRRLFNYVYGPDLCPECIRLAEGEKEASPEQEIASDSGSTVNISSNKGLPSSGKNMLKEEKEKFEQIRDYIMMYPKATVAQIAEANDIAPAKLFEWIKNERLEFSDNSRHAWFSCEKCGAKIQSGRLCSRCKQNN